MPHIQQLLEIWNNVANEKHTQTNTANDNNIYSFESRTSNIKIVATQFSFFIPPCFWLTWQWVKSVPDRQVLGIIYSSKVSLLQHRQSVYVFNINRKSLVFPLYSMALLELSFRPLKTSAVQWKSDKWWLMWTPCSVWGRDTDRTCEVLFCVSFRTCWQ